MDKNGIQRIDIKIEFSNGKRAFIQGNYVPENNIMAMNFTDAHKRPLEIEGAEAKDMRMTFEVLARVFRDGTDVAPDTSMDANEFRKNEVLTTFYGFDFTPFRFPMITVYKHPRDFPRDYVARLFDMNKRTPYILVKASLKEIHDSLPPGFTLMPRQPGDDPVIIEVWV